MIVLRRYVITTMRGDEPEQFCVDRCEQPPLDVLRHWAFHHVEPPLPVIDWLDRVLWRLHRRHCNDDCGQATLVATGEKVPSCRRLSLSAHYDLKCYDLTQKNLTVLERVAINKTTYEAMDGSYRD